MKTTRRNRREFLRTSLVTSAAAGWAAAHPSMQAPVPPARATRIRFAAIGLNHGHINGQVETVIRGGGELVSFYAKEPDLAAAFAKRFPQAQARASRTRDPRRHVHCSSS